jgi:hypothetical protein
MNDMSSTIVAKIDQIVADDLIGRNLTITVTSVEIKGGAEQPVTIHYRDENGKPYRPCKSMCRVLVNAWGADAKNYVGRSMTLYRDASVKFGGLEVGGIRISHLSHIDSELVMALTMSKANKKPYRVRPLAIMQPTEPKSTPRAVNTISQRVTAAVDKVLAMPATLANADKAERLTRPLLEELDAAKMPAEREALLAVLAALRGEAMKTNVDEVVE